MAKYIDMDALLEEFEHLVLFNKYDKSAVKEMIISMPKISDVAPVRHGRWVIGNKTYGEYICSVCHGIDSDCDDYYSSHQVIDQDYCPYCGAKMDGGEK